MCSTSDYVDPMESILCISVDQKSCYKDKG